ncbi:2-hydroxyacyl-CoA lyase 2, partial [Passer montanus]|uniref:2-hydroxyacyl-CoA lyase 2 n=1 Tax=Passer montanus TaxID=9160 RepID=UPI0019621DF1
KTPQKPYKIPSRYLRNYVSDLFAGAWEPRELSPLPLSLPRASPKEVQLCSELLSRAQRPLVLVGSQALLPPTEPEELRAALESLGVPCYLGGAARGLLPPECPLLLRQNRRDALRDADLVLLAGTVCDFRLSYGRLFGRGTAVVAVNRDREQLLRNSDVFWKPRLAVQGEALGDTNRDFGDRNEPVWGWNEPGQEAESGTESRNRAKAAVSPPCHLNPLAVLQALEQVLPPQSILVADGGDFVATAAYSVRPRRPRTVWVLFGDGSLGFSLMEFDTFVRHKQLPLLGSAVGCGLAYSDYHAVAEALGGRGFVVDSAGDTAGDGTGDTAGDVQARVVAVLRAAQAECHRGHPVLVNALLGPSDFRQGSVSV